MPSECYCKVVDASFGHLQGFEEDVHREVCDYCRSLEASRNPVAELAERLGIVDESRDSPI